MSDAPERIWITNESPADEISWRDNIFFLDKEASVCGWDVGQLVEYVRADRIEELEAKLRLAWDAINGLVDSGDAFDDINATLAELTGGKDE